MTWRAQANGDEIDLYGPTLDSLNISLSGPTSINLSGYTVDAGVYNADGSTLLGSFSGINSSTATVLAVILTAAPSVTTLFVPGNEYRWYCALWSGGTVTAPTNRYTIAQGCLYPLDRINSATG